MFARPSILLAEVVVDIDNTVFIQGAIFALLLLALNFLLFRPWLEVRERRIAKIQGSLDRAQELRAKARELSARWESRVAEARESAAARRTERRKRSEHEADEVLAAARIRAAGDLEAAQRQIQTQAADARRSLTSQVAPLSREIASRMLGRTV